MRANPPLRVAITRLVVVLTVMSCTDPPAATVCGRDRVTEARAVLRDASSALLLTATLQLREVDSYYGPPDQYRFELQLSDTSTAGLPGRVMQAAVVTADSVAIVALREFTMPYESPWTVTIATQNLSGSLEASRFRHAMLTTSLELRIVGLPVFVSAPARFEVTRTGEWVGLSCTK